MPPTIRSASTRPPVRVARPSWCRQRARPTCLDTDRGRAPVIARSWRSRRCGTTTLEEDVGLPSAGPGGEHLLPVQVDHWRRPSSAQFSRAGDGGRPCVQHPQSDDGAWQASVVRHRSVKDPWVGIVASEFRFMHQRRYNPARNGSVRLGSPRFDGIAKEE